MNTDFDPKDLSPGTVLGFERERVTLERRKEAGEGPLPGWWLRSTDQVGLADDVIRSQGWTVVARPPMDPGTPIGAARRRLIVAALRLAAAERGGLDARDRDAEVEIAVADLDAAVADVLLAAAVAS